MVLLHSLSSVKIKELVKSYIVDSKVYKLLVLVAIMLLASFSLVREGRAYKGNSVEILV
jgi:hypothetical protein